jgi:hypothetical protein
LSLEPATGQFFVVELQRVTNASGCFKRERIHNEGEAMPGKKTRQREQKTAGIKLRRARIVVAVAVLLSLLAAWTILAAYSGTLDSALSRKGRTTQTVSIESMNATSPSKEYIYAGGRLVATEEPVPSGCASPPSPGNTLVATAQTENSVVLNWAPSAGADHYEVQRKQNINSAWVTLSPNPSINSFTDFVGVVANTAYLYQVRAVDALGACPSAYGNVDLATTVLFTDDPLVAQLTQIKAVHVTELRTAVNAVRATANFPAVSWTDDPLQSQITVVKAAHVEQLRTKLDEARLGLGFTTGGYTDSPLATGAAGTNVKKVHIDELRQRVK